MKLQVNLFQQTDYRTALKATLLALKATNARRYTFQAMSQACRVQKTYLSRVLGGHGELSEDQLYLACEFLGLSKESRDYVCLLHGFQRSLVAPRKRELKKEIDAAQKKHSRSEKFIAAVPIVESSVNASTYHLDPNVMLVHMFLTVPRFSTNPKLVASQLGLSVEHFADALTQLRKLGLVEIEHGKITVRVERTHLPYDSPLYKASNSLHRLKCLEYIQRLPADSAYNLSVAFSANDSVRKKINENFLSFLSQTQKQVVDADPENVYQMNFDLFPWSF
jgi:hypothetical protein